jgi:hypothetical protein
MYQKLNIMDNTTLLTLLVGLAVLVTFGKTLYKLLKVLLGFAAVLLALYWVVMFNDNRELPLGDLQQRDQPFELLPDDPMTPPPSKYYIPDESQRKDDLLKTIGYDGSGSVPNIHYDNEDVLDLRNIDSRKPLSGSDQPDMTINVHHYFHGEGEVTNKVLDQGQRVSLPFIEDEMPAEPIGNANYVLIGAYAKTKSEAIQLVKEYQRLHLRTGYINLTEYNKNGRNGQYGVIVARPCRSLESIQRYFDEVREKTQKSLPSYDIVYLK